MTQLLIPIALAISLMAASQAPRAATVDLRSLSSQAGINSSVVAGADLATLSGTASLGGEVLRLLSFEWNFTAFDDAIEQVNDYSFFFSDRTGTVELADLLSVGGRGSSGWTTYTFAGSYSGPIVFGVANVGDDEVSSTLALRNLQIGPAVSPVPEPETFAMLLAGLGLMGTLAGRSARRAAAV